MDLYLRAKQYEKEGWTIIPTIKGGKTPLIQWSEFQNRKPTDSELKEWFENKDVNMAVITGKASGIVVLDFEVGSKYAQFDLPETLWVLTGSNGRHYYYKYPKGADIRTKQRIREKVDLLADVGLATLPPSVHENGNDYRWNLPSRGWFIAELPKWVLEESFKAQKEKADFETIIKGVSAGERNASSAIMIGKFLRALDISEFESVGWPQAELWNQSNNPPLPIQELKETFKSIMAREIKSRKTDSGQKSQSVGRDLEIREKLISSKDFINKELPPIKWVVNDFIPTGLTILAAAGGRYKTFLILQIAKDLAGGKDVFKYFKGEKKNILFVNEETQEIVMQDRLKLFGGEAPENLYFTHFANIKLEDNDIQILLDICEEKKIDLVILDSITRIQSIENENDSVEVKKVYEKLRKFLEKGISVLYTHHDRKTLGFGPQGGSEDVRGSSDYVNQADCVLKVAFISDDKNFLVISMPKRRAAMELNPFKIKIVKDGRIAFIYDGEFKPEDVQAEKVETYRESVLETIKQNPGIQIKEIYAKLKGQAGQKTIDTIIKEGEEKGRIISKTKKPKTLFLQEINDLF